MALPFSTFFAVHLEVGGDTESLKYQEKFWPAVVSLVTMAEQYNAKLTLQFNPQWAEYILQDEYKLDLLKQWQKYGHEVGLHHHGYDHRDWNGYTNRSNKQKKKSYRGNMKDAVELIQKIAYPYEVLTGTITDETFDYPEDIKYDTQGIRISHARSIPKYVSFGCRNVIQLGMALLSSDVNIPKLRNEYEKSTPDEVFGVITHEEDFAKNPNIIKEWFIFISSSKRQIKTISEIMINYQKLYPVAFGGKPLTFSKDVSRGILLKSMVRRIYRERYTA